MYVFKYLSEVMNKSCKLEPLFIRMIFSDLFGRLKSMDNVWQINIWIGFVNLSKEVTMCFEFMWLKVRKSQKHFFLASIFPKSKQIFTPILTRGEDYSLSNLHETDL